MAAPLPSSTTRSGDSDRATATPSSTFDTATAPASPPPQRRHPTVTTPATTAVSRWSEAACRPRRESSRSESTVGRTCTVSGSGGPPRPIATTTTLRDRASERATWPVTAVFPTRFPVPITASVGTSTGSIGGGVEAEVRPLVGDAEREHATREREPLGGAEHRLVGEVEDDVRPVLRDGLLERRHERDPVPVDVGAELLGASDQHGGDDEVVDLLQGRAHDGRIVLAVDDRDCTARRGHPRVVTSRSIRLVYFSYSKVSVENWMIRSSPWNGWRREIETWCPLTSITL